MGKLYGIYKADGKLRLTEMHSNYGDPPINGPYIATNKRLLAQWCLPGDTVKRIEVEVDRG